jgi:hypothetical protein
MFEIPTGTPISEEHPKGNLVHSNCEVTVSLTADDPQWMGFKRKTLSWQSAW